MTDQETAARTVAAEARPAGAGKPMAAESLGGAPDVSARSDELPADEAPAVDVEPDAPENEASPTGDTGERVTAEERGTELPRGTVSTVGEPYPLPEASGAAEQECVCPVEPSSSVQETVEVLRDWRAESRYRRPVGSATRVAGGPPEGFDRPPPGTRDDPPAIPGGFERPPVTADDLGP